MVIDPKAFIQFAVRKQFKISHVPCEVLVFAKEDLPSDIMQKIADQYSEDFTDDAKYLLFAKGPIDKEMIKKIFKATDKALGEDANKMTEGDFKLLKMTAADDDMEIVDPGDETPDSEIEAIIGKEDLGLDDDEDDDDEDEDPIDIENEKVIGDMLKAGEDEDEDKEVSESQEVDEAGLSLDDILKKGNDIAAKRNAEVDAEKAKKLEQKIKQIWIKEINIDTEDENHSVAKLQITYMDGKVEDVAFPIGTTGSDAAFKGNKEFSDYAVSGERYRQGDASYKQTLQNLKRAFAKYHLEPTDEDVRIAQIRNAFNDYRIKWLYGADKKDDPMFAFSRTEASASPKAVSKLAALRSDGKDSSSPKGRVVYSNGSTTIYKANEAEDNSLAARMHQGKSMAQWEKEFKGEFTMPQIWRMAASGCDLQKLALNVAGLSTLEDSELNEAKKDDKKKDEDEKEKEDKKEDKKEEASEESKEDSKEESKEEEKEEKKDEASEEQKGGQNPSGVAEENPNIPTKWVFLKITLKK